MIFVTGGARSGKSGLAERLAAERGEAVTYIATARAGDEEMAERIARHQRLRPAEWMTVEAPVDLAGAVEDALEDGLGTSLGSDARAGAGGRGDGSTSRGSTVLIDCLTVYISNVLLSQGIASAGQMRLAVDREVDRLVDACTAGNGRVIIVSNEVGMGIVPDNTLARTFRDAAGRANQKLATAAEEVYLCVSGIPVKVK